MLVDSHCHLDFDELARDRAGVLARARTAGVGTLLTIGTRRDNAAVVKGIADENANIFCTVGIHPHEADSDALLEDELIALSQHPKVVGLGETGLDFYYDHSDRDRQATSFRAHCAAARATGLPIVVHTRNADAETANILREECARGPLSGVIHCFSSGTDLARICLDLGFYISFSGIVTFKNADLVREAVGIVPLDRLLVETDAPYLAPIPKRGRPNEPAFVAYTAARVAEIKGVTQPELATLTTDNFFRLFDRAARPA